MANTNAAHVNRTYRSTVFIMLFEEKENLLELYNAMSGKHYTDPELLEINTLENAIYMSIKNDVSFLLDGRLSLYEHQSTYSPNLPLRFLFYISNLYSGMTKDENLYGTRKAQIPTPEFVIFYNGEEERPERETLKLSDLYTFREKDKEDGKTGKADFKLELKAELLNICGDNNKALKEACRTLREYAVFTDKMRKYTKTMDIQAAAERTIEECIQEDILREFLTKHRAEVRTMSIFEYDQEKHMRQEREQAWEEGWEAGMAEGEAKWKAVGIAEGLAEGKAAGLAEGGQNKLLELIGKKLRKGKTAAQIADELEESEDVIEELIKSI